MIGEPEAVRGRLFTIRDVTQSTDRAWLQVFLRRVAGLRGKFKALACSEALRIAIWRNLGKNENPVALMERSFEGKFNKSSARRIRMITGQMIEGQEAICGCLFTIQDVMVRAWLQVMSLTLGLLTHQNELPVNSFYRGSFEGKFNKNSVGRDKEWEMIEEQEAICGRLFAIQEVMQSTGRACMVAGAFDTSKL
ncbi:hypothetical protein BUALT_Bualt03G0032500 [Buddleja alternifolia]|uniref:Uncharacterized protein n=1 Tax=Buddleja alternifolia TaxID=168488 RepID=A0AAV6XY76_9LAMI|nr:hypothetical protein BUALT_Bualt03G0032500 [Buddleja alternifolia]